MMSREVDVFPTEYDGYEIPDIPSGISDEEREQLINESDAALSSIIMKVKAAAALRD